MSEHTKIKKFKTEIGEATIRNDVVSPIYSTRINENPLNRINIEQEFIVNQDGAVYFQAVLRKGDKITVNKAPDLEPKIDSFLKRLANAFEILAYGLIKSNSSSQ